MHLRPACQPRLHPVPVTIAIEAVLKTVDVRDPLGARTDKRHIAPYDVPELGKLVNGGAPEKSADPAHPAAKRGVAGDYLAQRVGCPIGVRLGIDAGGLVKGPEL